MSIREYIIISIIPILLTEIFALCFYFNYMWFIWYYHIFNFLLLLLPLREISLVKSIDFFQFLSKCIQLMHLSASKGALDALKCFALETYGWCTQVHQLDALISLSVIIFLRFYVFMVHWIQVLQRGIYLMESIYIPDIGIERIK